MAIDEVNDEFKDTGGGALVTGNGKEATEERVQALLVKWNLFAGAREDPSQVRLEVNVKVGALRWWGCILTGCGRCRATRSGPARTRRA